MTAENPEPNDASTGEDLRARYLPVTRKELRRQREAELTQKRRRKPRAESPVVAESAAEEVVPEARVVPETDIESAAGAETAADLARGSDPEADVESSEPPAFTTGSESTSGPRSSPAPSADWGFSLPAPSTPDSTPISAPEAAAEADLMDPPAAEEDEGLGVEVDEPSEDHAGPEDQEGPETSEDSETAENAELSLQDPEDAEIPDDAESSLQDPEGSGSVSGPETPRPQDLAGTELEDLDDAPVPASRKSRRTLRVSENIAELSEGRLAELQEITEALTATDDPHRVDPELLKKQQALAARAMQANQERLRKEQLEADRDAKDPRRRLRPESEVITRKTLRAHTESDEPAERTDHPTGSIEPIQARGAHGLEIDAMVEHSTRQGTRQSMIGWLVIILAVLLIIAVGVVLSFIL